MTVLVLFAASFLADPAEIRAVLDAQMDDWNRGDITAFLRGYDRSPDITFLGQSGVSRGYDGVEQRYRKSYATQAKMGKLRFSEIEVRLLGEDHALVLGRFELTREAEHGGPASGRFSLVFVKRPVGWRILHDHTS